MFRREQKERAGLFRPESTERRGDIKESKTGLLVELVLFTVTPEVFMFVHRKIL